MPKTPAAEVDAGGRAVRVSSPDRVIYEATDSTPEVTKLMVAEYFASVDDGLMRALRDRPTALERWTSGVREGMRLATGPQDKDADAFYQKRVPKGAPDYLETVQITFPSGRTAEEICPTEIAVPVWCAHMGTLVFHPWPVRRADVDHPDELRIDLDPQPGTSFGDAVRVAGVARELLEELGITGYPKTSGNRGVHIFVRIKPEWEFTDLRHAAIGFGRELARRDDGVTVEWWKEERGERIFVDFNQNNRDRTIASAYSLRPLPGAPVSTPMTWDELAGVTDPRDYNLFTVPDRVADGDPWAGIDDTAHSLEPLLQALGGAARRRAQLPAGLPQDAGGAAAGAAEQEGRVALGRRREPDRVTSRTSGWRATTASRRSTARPVRAAGRRTWTGCARTSRPRCSRCPTTYAGAARCRAGGRRSSCSATCCTWSSAGSSGASWGSRSTSRGATGRSDEPWDPEANRNGDARWVVADDVTAEELAERLAAIGARTTAILRDFPLDATASPGGRFADDPPSLEWICFHVLAEYARHAGQLDVAVEVPEMDRRPVRLQGRSQARGAGLPEPAEALPPEPADPHVPRRPVLHPEH